MRSSSALLLRRELSDEELVAALRAGDESAFMDFVTRHQRTMLRIARGYVSSDAVAEEVVQDTWEAAMRGLERFEGRSRLKTWVFRILINGAKSRGATERRTIPFSALQTGQTAEPAVDPSAFESWEGFGEYWAQAPRPWEDAERRLVSLELREQLRDALDRLPPAQRLVVALRDVEGLTSGEVCSLLDISEVNQRVLLHRGRSALRQSLDAVLAA